MNTMLQTVLPMLGAIVAVAMPMLGVRVAERKLR